MATHFSIFAWEIPRTEEAGRLQSKGLQSWTRLSTRGCCAGRIKVAMPALGHFFPVPFFNLNFVVKHT